jgi:hypothetical protein
MLALSGLVHQISGDAAETADRNYYGVPGLFEQTRGVAAQYNIRPPSGPRGTPHNRYPPSSAVSSFGRYSNARLIAKHQ